MNVIFHDFLSLENEILKFQGFLSCVSRHRKTAKTITATELLKAVSFFQILIKIPVLCSLASTGELRRHGP